jgi:hypothetical protein
MKKIVLFILCCFIMGCSSGPHDIMKITKITPTSNPTYCLYEARSITFTNSSTHSLFYSDCSDYRMNDSVLITSESKIIGMLCFISIVIFIVNVFIIAYIIDKQR